jgi:hypothetical protein
MLVGFNFNIRTQDEGFGTKGKNDHSYLSLRLFLNISLLKKVKEDRACHLSINKDCLFLGEALDLFLKLFDLLELCRVLDHMRD